LIFAHEQVALAAVCTILQHNAFRQHTCMTIMCTTYKIVNLTTNLYTFLNCDTTTTTTTTGIFNTLGTNTHLFTRGPKVLKKFDPLVVDALTVEMKRSGIHLHPNSSIKSVSQDAVTGKFVIETASGTKHDSYDVVLMAVGRHPTLAPLNLEAVNVKLNDTGHIATDEYENTSVAGIYALGDVNGKIELTPMAIAAGKSTHILSKCQISVYIRVCICTPCMPPCLIMHTVWYAALILAQCCS
jgi:Pyridine nucleotide-disulphide oxidoreductase